jgi:pimeloyl-ACP methyl ester carboxylesterase
VLKKEYFAFTQQKNICSRPKTMLSWCLRNSEYNKGDSMTTFVLVPGMWLGGWAWHEVAEALRATGHRVYPVTLTGLGERSHLGSREVNLDTHVTDVANVLRYEDLHDVILVGHSHGGTVVTAAADQNPERIAHLVYVDTWPLPDGVAQIDLSGPEGRAAQERQVAANGDGWRLPLPPWEELDQGNELAGLGESERRHMRTRATDQPFGTVTEPVRYPAGAWTTLRRTAIWCSLSIAEVQGLMAAYPQVTSTLAVEGWEFVELPTGHWPMFSRPHDLAMLLASLGI